MFLYMHSQCFSYPAFAGLPLRWGRPYTIPHREAATPSGGGSTRSSSTARVKSFEASRVGVGRMCHTCRPSAGSTCLKGHGG